jgi:hypothetical protein
MSFNHKRKLHFFPTNKIMGCLVVKISEPRSVANEDIEFRNLDLQKEMQVSRHGLNEGKYERYLFLVLVTLKEN